MSRHIKKPCFKCVSFRSYNMDPNAAKGEIYSCASGNKEKFKFYNCRSNCPDFERISRSKNIYINLLWPISPYCWSRMYPKTIAGSVALLIFHPPFTITFIVVMLFILLNIPGQ